MCMHFFMGQEPGNQGKVLMRYKFKEDDGYWAPYGHEGIPCFSNAAPISLDGLLAHPGIRVPKPWPEKSSIAAHLEASRRLSESEKAEWRWFFSRVPCDLEDLTEDQLFDWRLPALVQQFKDAKYVPPQPIPALGDGIGDSPGLKCQTKESFGPSLLRQMLAGKLEPEQSSTRASNVIIRLQKGLLTPMTKAKAKKSAEPTSRMALQPRNPTAQTVPATVPGCM